MHVSHEVQIILENAIYNQPVDPQQMKSQHLTSLATGFVLVFVPGISWIPQPSDVQLPYIKCHDVYV